MLDVLARDWAAGTLRFDAPGEALFAARDARGGLLGLGGITRDPYAAALRMRRFYVLPAARGAGTGRALALAALAHGRDAGVGVVRLRCPPGAARFWEALGFVPVAGDPEASHAMPLRLG